jgi:hypothetical protein
MENIDRETRPAGRSMVVTAFGDNADEIELAALDEVRPFFGAAVQLEVQRDYIAHAATEGQRRTVAAGKRYTATVSVRAIEPGGGQP